MGSGSAGTFVIAIGRGQPHRDRSIPRAAAWRITPLSWVNATGRMTVRHSEPALSLAPCPCESRGRMPRAARGQTLCWASRGQRGRRDRPQVQERAAIRKPEQLLRGQHRCPVPGGDIKEEIVALRIAAASVLAVQARQQVLSVGRPYQVFGRGVGFGQRTRTISFRVATSTITGPSSAKAAMRLPSGDHAGA